MATPAWRRIALPASLILNLFLVALIGGHLLHVRRGLAGAPFAHALANAEAILPPKDAAAFRAVMQRDAPQYEGAMKRFFAARQALERDIAADHFDPDRVRAALANWRTSWDAFFDDFDGPLVDALAQVSPEGRRKLLAERRRGEMSPR